ncbi:MAG TPA: hypothetical protein VFX78_10940 [Candidatus Eisenbacteria bacterium]|nr:hypothetical protein [Candidatus Eisenbacteria bacterium]
MLVAMILAEEARCSDNETVDLRHGSVAAMFLPPRGPSPNVRVRVVTSIAREGGDDEKLEIVTRIIGPDGREIGDSLRQHDDLPPPSLISLVNKIDLRLERGRYEIRLEINGEHKASCCIGVEDYPGT